MYVCIYVCIYIRMYVRMAGWMDVCMHVYVPAFEPTRRKASKPTERRRTACPCAPYAQNGGQPIPTSTHLYLQIYFECRSAEYLPLSPSRRPQPNKTPFITNTTLSHKQKKILWSTCPSHQPQANPPPIHRQHHPQPKRRAARARGEGSVYVRGQWPETLGATPCGRAPASTSHINVCVCVFGGGRVGLEDSERGS